MDRSSRSVLRSAAEKVAPDGSSLDFGYAGNRKVEREFDYDFTVRDLDGKVLRKFRTDPESETASISLDNIWLEGRLVGFVDEDGEEVHAHLDHLGTPRLHTDATGAKMSEHDYFPFGLEITDPEQDEIPMKFTGHERDSDLLPGTSDDLDYMHARYYSPHWGRFTSVDPIGGKPRNPRTWNRYAYAVDNTLKYLDPDGRTVVGFTGFGNNPGGITEVIEALQRFKDAVGPSRVFRHQDSLAGTAFLLGNPGGSLNALVGHSLGAYAALTSARRLNKIAGGIPIDLLATVDAAPNFPGRTTVPPNVALAINFFQGAADLGGTQLAAEDPSKTKVLNVEIRSAGHTQIDEAVASAIVGEILNLAAEQGADFDLKEGLQFRQGELIFVRK